MGVVEGGEIPYKPEALAKKKENQENWVELDPAIKCFMPGIPRATYMPFPFQIVQTPEHILIAYEFASASRVVYMQRPDFEAPVDAWMGHSRGHWDGESLVIDVTALIDQTWFDSSGNHHSDALHVVERYTPISPNALMYEATIEDPNVFTRPWKISMPLYRRLEKNAQLPGVQVRGVCRGTDVRPPSQEDQRMTGGRMSHRLFAGVLIAIALAAPLRAADAVPAAKTDSWTPPQTAWGEPDLRGVWDFRTITPLERPKELSGKTFSTSRKRLNSRLRLSGFATKTGGPRTASLPNRTSATPTTSSGGITATSSRGQANVTNR